MKKDKREDFDGNEVLFQCLCNLEYMQSFCNLLVDKIEDIGTPGSIKSNDAYLKLYSIQRNINDYVILLNALSDKIIETNKKISLVTESLKK